MPHLRGWGTIPTPIWKSEIKTLWSESTEARLADRFYSTSVHIIRTALELGQASVFFIFHPPILKYIEVVFHISSSWVRMRLHTKNQLSVLPDIGLKCNPSGVVAVVGWWWFS